MFLTLSDSTRLYVDSQSSGLRKKDDELVQATPLVLIHGGPGFDHVPFRNFFPRLAGRFEVIYYDHRGMGRSDSSSPDRWNLEQWSADLGELLDLLGLEKPILLGQSFGGYIAQLYASKNPDRIAGLILSSTAPRFVADDCLGCFAKLGGANAKKIAKAMFSAPNAQTFEEYLHVCMPLYTPGRPSFAPTGGQIIRPEVLFAFWKGEHLSFDLRPELQNITTPAWVLTGEADPITPPPRQLELAGALPSLYRLDLVEGAGHGVYRDQPDWFEREMHRFADHVGCAKF